MGSMDSEHEKIFDNAIRDGIRDGIREKFKGYNSPIEKSVTAAIEQYSTKFRGLLEESIASCLNDKAFREEIASAVRASLAKTLIQRFGGEMEKQVNVLKSDPTTRARITLAIEEIVKQGSH